MIPDKERITRGQYLSVCFIALLSPITRQIPRIGPELAGAASWLTGLAAVPWLILMELVILRLLKKRGEGEGMGQIFLRVYGRIPGRVILFAYALWLLAYPGFVLRAGANRLLVTVYPRGGVLVFILVMGALCLIAALGSVRTLARAASIFRPFLLAALLLVVLLALTGSQLRDLLPVGGADLLPVLSAGLPVANVLLLVTSFTFLEDRVELSTAAVRGKCVGRFFLLLVVLVTLLLAALQTNFGPELTLKQLHPFFTLAKNISLFRTLERFEALVLALWAVADFVLASGMLLSAITILRLVFHWDSRRLLPALCAGAAILFAVLGSQRSYEISFLAQKLFPISGAILLGLYPLALVVGLIRRRV